MEIHGLQRSTWAAGPFTGGTVFRKTSQAAGLLSLRVLAPTFRVLGLPLATIERSNRQLVDRFRIDAPCVHADAIRMRTRDIERFDAAHGTKQMPGRVSIETVGPERVTAAKQFKSIGRDHEVQVTGLAANGAVAFRYA